MKYESLQMEHKKAEARAWFEALQARIIARFEALEDAANPALYGDKAGRFERKPWARGDGSVDQGGGTMAIMRGRLFEKVGVHVSTVYGQLSEDFAKQIKGAGEDRRFWASGISLIAHMKNPRVPAVHMNTRLLATTDTWFGGGADLNPMIDAQRHQDHPDAEQFRHAFADCCNRTDASYFPKFKTWCDEYFYLPHRGHERGVGGIFFDHHNTGDFARDFAFTRDVGETFLASFPLLVEAHMDETWTAEELAQQLFWRGRYAEFNLLYDRGTTFGLKTGGNVEAILSSLPPLASWG